MDKVKVEIRFKPDSAYAAAIQSVYCARYGVFDGRLNFYAEAHDANRPETTKAFRSIAVDQIADFFEYGNSLGQPPINIR